MITMHNKKMERVIKNAFKDAQIYGTGVSTVSFIDVNKIEVKSIPPFDARDLFQSFEDNIVKDLEK